MALNISSNIVASEKGSCAVIDPGMEPETIINAIEQNGLTPKMILLTHGHYDHCSAVPGLKERYPDALVGYEQYGNFEFYGEDAKRVSELLSSKLLEKETALGKVEVSGFPREQWVSQAMKLWKQGESVYLSGQQEDGTHAQTKYFRREEYLPVNTIVELDDREFRVDSVNFEQRTVSLQDMTLAKKARYPSPQL